MAEALTSIPGSLYRKVCFRAQKNEKLSNKNKADRGSGRPATSPEEAARERPVGATISDVRTAVSRDPWFRFPRSTTVQRIKWKVRDQTIDMF